MPDSADIDAALTAKLSGDSQLAALLPDGWAFDQMAAGKSRFGIVSLVDEHDGPMFEGRASEDALYMVKAVVKSPSSAVADDAAARIDALLQLGTLTITGYHLLVMRRVERIRMAERDTLDSSILWQHRGGRYQVLVAPVLT